MSLNDGSLRSSQKQCLAHFGNAGEQRLSQHLFGVSKRAEALAKKLGTPKAGALIGLLHDLGKSSDTFQNYLLSFDSVADLEPQNDLRGRIDHSTAGAQCIVRNIPGGEIEASLAGLASRLLAVCVASHHSGLIDCLLPEGGDDLSRRLKKDDSATHYSEAWSTIDPEIRLAAEGLMHSPELLAELKGKVGRVINPLQYGVSITGDTNFQLGLFLRFLFSCLIDADRTDTADFESPISAQHRQDGRYESWDVLLERLERSLKNLYSQGTPQINEVRCRVSSQCDVAASRPRGIYTLTVPTGGGKTLAALRFALKHARIHAQERVIFVSPYISIVDQNAAVARSILEPEEVPFATIVLEHHSNLSVEREATSNGKSWRRKVLSENWDAPVVFTTMAQVLEAMFGAGTCPVRRLHALANAVIVFDEVQTLPVRLVHLFNNALNLLAAHCGSTILLCTATQPLLNEVDSKRGAAHLAAVPELVKNVAETFRQMRRYTVLDHTARNGGWSPSDVAVLACEEAVTHGSCLAVVNTRRDALEIFQLCRNRLPASAYIAHLSTGMCPAHRLETLAQLRTRLEQSDAVSPLLCVSTQLIEAGVDIDFAVVVRDLAGLDSLAQAAGRCNRNGRRTQPGRVHIVKLPDLPKQLDEIRKGQEVALQVLGEWRRAHRGEPFPLDDLAQMRRYYELFFFRRKGEMSYPVRAGADLARDTTLLELLGDNAMAVQENGRLGQSLHRSLLLQSFKTANETFALIGETQGVVAPFGSGGQDAISNLAAARDLEAEWRLLRAAQPYTISLYPSLFKRLQESGAVCEISNGTGVFCLRPEFYDQEFGLRSEAGSLEELIV